MVETNASNFGLRLILLSLGGLIFFESLACAQLPNQTERTWVDSTGKHQVVATLVKFESEIAVLRKENGVEIKLPFDRLSDDDQKYLNSLKMTPAGDESSPQTPLPEIVTADRPLSDVAYAGDVLNGESLSQLLAEQRIPDARKQLADLLRSWPNNPTPELIAAVTVASQTNDKFIRKLALQILSKYHAKDSLPVFIRLMDDLSFDVRWSAYEAIETLSDDRALDALMERFTGEDAGRIGSILLSYGPRAEEKLVAFLDTEQSKDVRLFALSLLGKIGTEKSIDAIEKIQSTAEDTSTRVQAQSVIAKIRERQSAEQQAGQQP